MGSLSRFRDGVDHLFVTALVASGVRRAGIDLRRPRVVELQEVTFSGQRSTGLIDDMRVAVIPSRHHGADAGGCAPAG